MGKHDVINKKIILDELQEIQIHLGMSDGQPQKMLDELVGRILIGDYDEPLINDISSVHGDVNVKIYTGRRNWFR